MSSAAQTCCGHPVRPLLFLPPPGAGGGSGLDPELLAGLLLLLLHFTLEFSESCKHKRECTVSVIWHEKKSCIFLNEDQESVKEKNVLLEIVRQVTSEFASQGTTCHKTPQSDIGAVFLSFLERNARENTTRVIIQTSVSLVQR